MTSSPPSEAEAPAARWNVPWIPALVWTVAAVALFGAYLQLAGTLADSNTAYVSSVKMPAAVGGARLLAETGGGHTSLLNQSTCVNDAIDALYASGALPTPGTVCDQDEPPF